jgi:hypothetical protein
VFFFIGGIHTLSSTGMNDKRNDYNLSQEKLNDQHVPIARLSRTTVSEECDSDFDDSSHEDDEQIGRKESVSEYNEQRQQQIIVEFYFS